MSQIKPKTPPSWWFSDAPVPLWSRALAALYARITALRRWLYQRGWKRRIKVSVPVIVVGNLIAGGSGKTPLVIALVERLSAAGFTPGVASRGYGREHPRSARWVDADTSPTLGGDEPVLIARRTGVKVRVDANRAAAAQALIAAGCDVIICDDGLQHYRLHRDLEIEVIDGQRGYGNGRLLPAGPLREPAARGEQCDFRVVNNPSPQKESAGLRPAPIPPLPFTGESRGEGGRGVGERVRDDGIPSPPHFPHWPMHLDCAHAEPLTGGRPIPLSQFQGLRIHAVAGIGHPERFFSMLRAQNIAVVPHAFPDHHHYQPEDLHFSSALPILMTEKDAVKCAGFADEHMYHLPINARLPEAFWVTLLDRLSHLRHV